MRDCYDTEDGDDAGDLRVAGRRPGHTPVLLGSLNCRVSVVLRARDAVKGHG